LPVKLFCVLFGRASIHGKAPFDLAVVRGNLDLSTDWPAVVV
jgi:hypothetical protein